MFKTKWNEVSCIVVVNMFIVFQILFLLMQHTDLSGPISSIIKSMSVCRGEVSFPTPCIIDIVTTS
jgi:hypothetical protein